jgi:hypothetical protein
LATLQIAFSISDEKEIVPDAPIAAPAGILVGDPPAPAGRPIGGLPAISRICLIPGI